MKHNYNNNDDFYKEDERASNNMSQSRRNINQVKFGPQKQKETKEEERFLSMQLISQEKKILPWGLMALRESDLKS